MLSSICSRVPTPETTATAAKEENPAVFLSLDEPSYLLLYSTYLRFLEMHDRVQRYLIACLSHKRGKSSAATGSCFNLPKLSFGSFSLARTSETRPLLFVNLMASMLIRARRLFHHIASAKGIPGGRGGQEGIDELPPVIEPDLALQAVRARQAAPIKLVERTKTTLVATRVGQ